MFSSKNPTLVLSFAALLLTALTSCSNSSVGKNLEQSLAADPNLKNNPVVFGQPATNTNPQNQPQAQLPPDFPGEIPRYPNAELQEVAPASASGESPLTRWTTSDPINAVQNFYQRQFQDNNWQLQSQPTDEAGGTFVARRNDLTVTVSIQRNQSNVASDTATPAPSQAATQLTIQYVKGSSETAAQPAGENTAATPSPTPTTIAPLQSANPIIQPSATPEASASNGSTSFSDLNKVPPELNSYVADVAQLGVLSVTSASKNNLSATSNQFEPNKAITRREFARWLVAANNQIHANRPAQQIRLGTQTAQPAFQDVPKTDPDFAAIQGLAEAGLIPSSLSGDSTEVLFRPDAPLTREQMMLWKVPLDTRQALPNATFEAVKQTWGFQDATKIDPKALRAVLADFQNGDMANIRRLFGYTTLFQPKKPVTRAEAAATLWHFGSQGEGISAKDALQLKQQSQ